MKLGTYKFGSRVMQTYGPDSDKDNGVVLHTSATQLYVLDTSKGAPVKNNHIKQDGNDVEYVYVLRWFQQCMRPSINFHAKLMTLDSKHIDTHELKRVIDDTLNWRSYLFSSLSFTNSAKDTLKGRIHRAYALSLCNEQLNNKFTVEPDFWVGNPNYSELQELVKARRNNSQINTNDYMLTELASELERSANHFVDDNYSLRKEALADMLHSVVRYL